MAKTKEEEEAEKLSAAAKKPYTVGEIAGKVGGFFSEAFSGPTTNYLKREEREKREAGQDNTGRAAATAAAVGSAVSRGVSAAGSAIADKAQGPVTDDNITGGSGTASVFGGVIPQPTSGNAAGGADQPAITNEPNEFDKAEDFLKQARSRNRGMSDEVANVMADIDMARAETGLGRESEDSPAAPEAPAAPEGANEFLAAQKDFNEKYGDGPSLGRPEEGETADQYEGRLRARNAARKALAELKPKDEAPDAYSAAKGEFNEKFGGSMGRAMEGETADQYDARLKQRNVDRKEALKELAKLKPQGGAPATPDDRVADTGGESTGIGFDDQAIDPDAGGFKAPTISPQASSSARDTASKPSKGNTSQPRPKRKLGEIRGNQFGAIREDKRDRRNKFGA